MLQAIHAPTAGADRTRSRCARSTPTGDVGRRGRRRLPARRRASRPTRNTETYAALRLEVDNWRWAGVPFYLRTGKRLARKVTEIAVTLKPVPHLGVQAGGLARRAAQPADPDHAAQRGRVAVARGQDPRHAHAHPPGEHGVPLRHVVPVAVARGLRAADPRRHARRRDALHPQRRGRGAVAHLRPDRADVGGDARAAAAVPGRLAGPAGGRPADARRATSGARSRCPASRTAAGPREGTTPGAIEAALREMLKRAPRRERVLRRPRAR